MKAVEFVDKNLDAMLEDLRQLVSFKSTLSDDAKPFGLNNRLVLDHALNRLESIGLKTTNLDYYCGFGEVGQGDKLIGILAHLDVVPAADGWKSDPFKMDIRDGVAYGRGVSDDKGAVVASMYALKYLIDEGYPFSKRVRLILGCNEENGSACLAHYVKKEGHIDLGYTPDGEFPGIYGEKGMFMAHVDFDKKHTKLLNINGGQATNVVNGHVELEVLNESFNINKFENFISEKGLTCEVKVGETTKIVVNGTCAHASLPDLGKNAINHALVGLKTAGYQDEFVDYFDKHIGLGVHGEKADVNFKDEYGDLSFNVGVIETKADVITFSIDIRFPVSLKVETVRDPMLKHFNDGAGKLVIEEEENPLFVDPESPMCKAMYQAYVDVTGDDKTKMMVIGGGTYAKGINNCIAFGCQFLGEDNHIHDNDEKLIIEELKQQVLIYIEAIKNLDKVAL